jgi:hypothetical protein
MAASVPYRVGKMVPLGQNVRTYECHAWIKEVLAQYNRSIQLCSVDSGMCVVNARGGLGFLFAFLCLVRKAVFN